MIEVAHLTRRFGQHVAVDDVSFRLERGEVVGFLGPNGAGKTTTMRMLTGFLPATSAERLEVAGFDVLRKSLEVRRRIGYLPEAVPLYGEMRVREMLLFQGRLHGMSRAKLREAVPAVLDRVGVRDRERQLVGTLSRGLRQRVGLAVALLPEPEVLILDEPTSGLDPIQRREVRRLIADLASQHTVLLSSHILAEIESIAPRAIILHEGRVVADGTHADLVRRLGGAGHVRFEAAAGNPAEAVRLLESLPGVTRANERGRVGIHHAYEVHGEGDLREDVGALAAQRGWAVRELSMRRPTLEELFARLVLGGKGSMVGDEDGDASGAPPMDSAVDSAIDTGAAPEPSGSGLISLGMAPSTAPPAATSPDLPVAAPAQPEKKTIYSLNPFDRGAERALNAPVDTDAPPPPTTPPGTGPGEA